MKKSIVGLLSAMGTLCCSCQKDLIEYSDGDLKIKVEAGEE